MPATNSLVPATNLHPVDSFDIESQQTIQTAPHRYNKAVTFAKLGAMAGVCAATAGLMLADLANRYNITLPVQHTSGRELLDVPVNGTCPEGQTFRSKEDAMNKAKLLLGIGAGLLPGLTILSGVLVALPDNGCSPIAATVCGLSSLATGPMLPVSIMAYVIVKNHEGDYCYS